MLEAHWAALREVFRLPRPTARETAAFALVYVVQATGCVLLLEWLYHVTSLTGVTWAIISSILALQPGSAQSFVTSILRILANTVGASVAFLIGSWLGTGEWQLLLSIAVVVVACELLRLDLALRTACVAVVIVLTSNNGLVRTSSLERFTAVLIGCTAALIVQSFTDFLRGRFFRQTTPNAVEIATHAAELGKQKPAQSQR